MAQYTCPQCERPFTAAAAPTVTRVRCPHCRQAVELPAAPKARWFFARDKKKYGPYTWQQLLGLVKRGDLRPGDLLLQEGTKQWVRAETVPGLFAEAPASKPYEARIANPAYESDAKPLARRSFLWLCAALAGVGAFGLLGLGGLLAFFYFQREPPNPPPHVPAERKDDEPKKLDPIDPPKKDGDPVQKDQDPPKKNGNVEPIKNQPEEKWAEQFVTRLNEQRKSAGLGTVTLDPDLSLGCAAHAKYLARHVDPSKAEPSSVYDEDEKKPGYSSQGQQAAQNALVAFSAPIPALERWMARLPNRVPLLSPQMQSVGIGFEKNERGQWFCVVDPVRGSGEPVVVYPVPKQTDVPISFSGGPEVPEPNAAAGFPITVVFPPGKQVSGGRIELHDSQDKAIGAWTWTPEQPVRPGLKKNMLALIAKRLLQSNAVYHVKASAQIDGRPWRLAWSFTTEDDSDSKGLWAKKALDKVNAYRAHAGLKPVVLDSALSRGCLAHARYLVINEGHPSLQGLKAHHEDPKLPGYSAEGDKTGQNSDIGFGTHEPIDSVDAWMATLYHRVPILEPNLQSIGFGCARGRRQGWATVMNVSSGRPKGPRPHAVFYPVPGQIDVPLSFPNGGEEPNPIPDDKDGRAGFPITAFFPADQVPKNATGKLTDAKGGDVATWFSSKEKPANPNYAGHQGNTICVIAKDPLLPSMTYQVHLQGTLRGAAWEKRWKFTTADAGLTTRNAARAVVERLNHYRAHAGLGAVIFDEKLSRGCQLHAEYLGKNTDVLLKTKASVNDEDPQLPWYNIDGRRSAQQSFVFTNAPTPVMQIDDLMATAISRSVILDPSLQRIGYGCYHDIGRGWRCVLDPNGGRGHARVVVYPAANQAGVPTVGFDRVEEAKGDVGFPITVTFPPRANLRSAQAILVDADQKAVAFRLSSPEKPLNAKLQRNTIAVHPLASLQAGRAYSVTVSVIVDSIEWRQTWQFTTGK